MNKKVEVKLASRSEEDIDNTINSVTRNVEVEDLVREGRTKNLKMIKESQLRKILSTIIEKLISERDLELSEKEREVALLQSQAMLGGKSAANKADQELANERDQWRQRCENLALKVSQLESQQSTTVPGMDELVEAIQATRAGGQFLLEDAGLESAVLSVDQDNCLKVAPQLINSLILSLRSLEEMQVEKEAAQDVIADLRAEASRLKQDHDASRMQWEGEKAKLTQQLLKEQVKAHQENEEVTKSITKQLANVTSVKNAQTSEITGLITRVKDLEAQVAEKKLLPTQLSTAQFRIKELEGLLLSQEDQRAEGEKAIASYRKECDSLRQQIKQLESTSTKSERDLTELGSQAQYLKSKSKDQESLLHGYRSKVKKLEQDVDARDKRIEASEGKVQDLQDQIAQLSSQFAKDQDLQDKIKHQALLLSQNQVQIEGQSQKIVEQVELIDQEQAKIRELEAQLAAAMSGRSKIQELETLLAGKNDDLAARSAELDDLRAHVASLESGSQEMTKINSQLMAQIEELHNKQVEAPAPEPEPELEPEPLSLPKVKNRNRRPSVLSHGDGDQRGNGLLLNGPTFDLVKRSGAKEGGAVRIYRRHNSDSMKAVSNQPFKAAPAKTHVLMAWRLPGKSGERLLVASKDGDLSIFGGDGYQGRLDDLVNSRPATDARVSCCVDPSFRQSHLVWCDNDGRLVHVVDVGAQYFAEYPHVISDDGDRPNYVDCTIWYRSADESVNIVALTDDGDLHHYTSAQRSAWQMNAIESKVAATILPGTLNGYAPGSYHHILFVGDDSLVHEYWSEQDEWHHETIGETARSTPCREGALPVGGYTEDRHVVSFVGIDDLVKVLEYTDEWRSVEVPDAECPDGKVYAQFYAGEARLAWRDQAGLQFARRTTENGWGSE